MSLFTPKLRRHWDRLEGPECRDLQITRLRHFLTRQVVPFSKYYGRLFRHAGVDPDSIRHWEDLERIPFSSKSDLLSIPGTAAKTRDFVLIPEEAVLRRRASTLLSVATRGMARTQRRLRLEYRPILMTSTTGRSADPVPFLYTQHDLDNLAVTGTRLMQICRSDADFRHLNMFPFAPHLAFWQTHYAGLGFNAFCLSTGGGKVMGTDGNVKLLEKIQPDALIGMPTFIYHVLQQAVSQGLKSPHLKRVVLGGEKAPEGMRRKLRSLCEELGSPGALVMGTYGFTECKTAWPECPPPDGAESSGYHLYPDLGLIEIVDPETGKQVGEGEPGEIVYTPLDSRGTVVLRYRTGDHISGGLVHEPCPHCGRNLPRLVGRISRVTDVRSLNIDKIKGTLVNFNDLENLLDDLDDLGAWQIEIRKRNNDPLECDELVVHAQAKDSSTNLESLTRSIQRRFVDATEISPNGVIYHNAEEMQDLQGVGRSLKEEKVADRRPKPASTH